MAKSKPRPKASGSKPRAPKARTTKSHTLPKAMPPADDPLRRFVEQNTDLLTGDGEAPEAAGAALMAAAAPVATERGTRGRAVTSADFGTCIGTPSDRCRAASALSGLVVTVLTK